MERKAVFLDIDGTLTEPGTNEPPESAAEAVRQARECGHYVSLCTGRSYGMLLPLLRYGFDGVIASAGGYVECQGQVIYDGDTAGDGDEGSCRVRGVLHSRV